MKKILTGLIVLGLASVSFAATVTYTIVNNADRDLVVHWPLGCSPDIYKTAKSFVSCSGMKKSGVMSPHSSVVCKILAAGFPIACFGKDPCLLRLYDKDSCSGADIATADIHFSGVFDHGENEPGSRYHLVASGNTVTINLK